MLHEPKPAKKKPRRRKHQDLHSGSHIGHPDEKWLVSYSDLMTLLFGLFVMLYSIAMEKQGSKNMDQALKQISQAVSQADEKPTPAPVTTPTPEVTLQNPDQVDSVAARNVAGASVEPSEKDLDAELKKAAQENAKLIQDLEDAKSKSTEFEKQWAETLKEKETLAKKLKGQRQENEDTAEQAQVQAQEKDQQLQHMAQRLEKSQADINAAEQKLGDSEKKIQDLQAEQDRQLKRGQNILLMAKWSQEKYDIDFEVKDPAGHWITYRNRSENDGKTLFLADSIKGPGAEIVRTNSGISGQYVARVKIYNSHGETDAAHVELVALTRDGEKILKRLDLDKAKKNEQSVTIQIDADGTVQVP